MQLKIYRHIMGLFLTSSVSPKTIFNGLAGRTLSQPPSGSLIDLDYLKMSLSFAGNAQDHEDPHSIFSGID